jgi:hypothetical protein
VTRTEQILDLTPRQALAVMQYMTASLAERRVDEHDFDTEEQIEVLNAAFQVEGYPAILPAEVEASEEASGQAAQQFLLLLTEMGDDELLKELDEWLAEPPEASIAALPLVLLAPIVLTGCIIALQTGVVIERTESGEWSFRIERQPLAGEALIETIKGLFGVTRLLPSS